jgi:hypothetical protein
MPGCHMFVSIPTEPLAIFTNDDHLKGLGIASRQTE